MKEHKPLLLHVESVPSQDDLSWPRIQPVRSSPDVATVHVGTAYTVTHSLTVRTSPDVATVHVGTAYTVTHSLTAALPTQDTQRTDHQLTKNHTRIKLHQYMANASH